MGIKIVEDLFVGLQHPQCTIYTHLHVHLKQTRPGKNRGEIDAKVNFYGKSSDSNKKKAAAMVKKATVATANKTPPKTVPATIAGHAVTSNPLYEESLITAYLRLQHFRIFPIPICARSAGTRVRA
ncbi:MAG: hypothetical protein WCF90_06860 [Methanomicrobiales archaeon]